MRPFRSAPRVEHVELTLEISRVDVEVFVTEVCLHEEFTLKPGPPITTTWEEMLPDPQVVALLAAYDYFLSIGCEGHETSQAMMVRLPLSTTEWCLKVEDSELRVFEWYDPRTASFAARIKPRRSCSAPLADPECFPKMLAYMQKQSKFLRGGTNHAIPTIKAL